VTTASSLRLAASLPMLARCAREATGELARLACAALGRMGPDGCKVLEGMTLGEDPMQAARAAEGLAAARVGWEPA